MARRVNTYRVVGIRADGSQHVLSARLSLEDASYVMRVLISVEIFQKVVVQPDHADDAIAGSPSVVEDRPVYEDRRRDEIA
jgi:hypothetical protein